jgi:hypothetical protein
MTAGGVVIFQTKSKQEFDRMTVDQRMEYLHRLMTDIREKLAVTRKQQEDMVKTTPKGQS